MSRNAQSFVQALADRLPQNLRRLLVQMRSSQGSEQGSAARFRYDRMLQRIEVDTLKQASRLRQDSSQEAGLVGSLSELPHPRRRMLLFNQPEDLSLGLVPRLLRLSWEKRSIDPVDSEDLARLAVEILDHLSGEPPAQALIQDLRARAWGQIGNARRIRSDLHGAEEAFATARRHLDQGPHDPLEEALFHHWLGGLRRDQRRFQEAIPLLQAACRLYRKIRDDESRAQALITLGIAYREASDPERALTVMARAAQLLPEGHPAHLHVRHNQIFYLIDLGRYVEAERLLAKTRPLYAHSPEALTRLRLPWVEGRLAKHTGRLQEAEYLFQKVRQSFVRHGIGYDAALVSLELAEIYACQGRTYELKRLAGEMVTVFRSRNVERETLAALLMLQHAASAEQATLHVIRDIAAKLRRRAPSTPPFRSEES